MHKKSNGYSIYSPKTNLNPRKGINNVLQGNPWAFRSKIQPNKAAGTAHGRACKAHNRACLNTQKQQREAWDHTRSCVWEHKPCEAFDVVQHGWIKGVHGQCICRHDRAR